MTVTLTPLGSGQDDGPQIQTNINNESVVLDRGEWLIGGAGVDIPSDRSLTGKGWDTHVKVEGGLPNFTRSIRIQPPGANQLLQGPDNVLVSDFRLNGQGELQEPGQPVAHEQNHNLWIMNASNITVRRMFFRGPQADAVSLFGRSIQHTGGVFFSRDHLIEDCTFTDHGRTQIGVLTASHKNLTITGCSFDLGEPIPNGQNVNPLHIEPPGKGLIDGVVIENCVVHGKGVSCSALPDAAGLSVIRNIRMKNIRIHSDGTTGTALTFHRCAGVQASDIRISGTWGSGVNVRDSGESGFAESGFVQIQNLAAVGTFTSEGISVVSTALALGDSMPGGVTLSEVLIDGSLGKGIDIFPDTPWARLQDCVVRNTGGNTGIGDGDAFRFNQVQQVTMRNCRAINHAGRGFLFSATQVGGTPIDRVLASGCTHDEDSADGVLVAGDVTWDGQGIGPAPAPTLGFGIGFEG